MKLLIRAHYWSLCHIPRQTNCACFQLNSHLQSSMTVGALTVGRCPWLISQSSQSIIQSRTILKQQWFCYSLNGCNGQSWLHVFNHDGYHDSSFLTTEEYQNIYHLFMVPSILTLIIMMIVQLLKLSVAICCEYFNASLIDTYTILQIYSLF